MSFGGLLWCYTCVYEDSELGDRTKGPYPDSGRIQKVDPPILDSSTPMV